MIDAAPHAYRCPNSYAKHLAGYISSPTKIESLVKLEFGKAPPLDRIARMRLRVEEERKPSRAPYTRDKGRSDHLDWRPATFVRKQAPLKPEARTYTDSGTVYIPAHAPVAGNDIAPLPDVRCHSEIVSAAGRAFGLTYEDMIAPRRTTRHVCARSVAVRILRERGNSFPQIGRYLGRDHSTIIHSYETFEARARQHPQVAQVYEGLTRRESEAA